MRKPVAGYVYVLEVTDGITKVGYSNRPDARVEEHAQHLQKEGRRILRQWISPRHAEAFHNEDLLVAACVDLGGRHQHPRTEWFTGLSFNDVVSAAKRLTFSECSEPSTNQLEGSDLRRLRAHPLRWPAWLAEQVAEAASGSAMSMASWLRQAALEKLKRDEA